ncbi:RDD family protein [Flavobacterium agricola]|uniref:RDD family protein n=1 Tax=Flavobacterium agricola TaxID=2870839 RepID=A0ABY6LY94_9FLAO|nr:RDD family protein [Flavobacterium agricola]UYW00390.1 RDD family protein [Flavobacterium agricola]
MEYIKINSSQNVVIDFKLANLAERIVAFFIDIALIIGYLWLLYWVIVPAFFASNQNTIIDYFSDSSRITSLYYVVFIVITALPVIFYSLLFELFLNGQTPGKIVMRIKVMKIDGMQMSFLDYLIRWMFRLIDIYLLYGIVAVLSILISKKGQRLGEIASGSATVSIKRRAHIKDTIFTELQLDYSPTFPQVILLTDNDMRLIKENYIIAKKNKDKVLLGKLSTKVLDVLEITNPFNTQDEFLNVIIKDYNYYTQYN